MRIISLILFAFIATKTFPQTNYLLQGTIGKHKIIMRISSEDDTTIYARYFYANHLQDIFLEGKLNDDENKLVLIKNEWGNKQERDSLCEKFSLSTKNYKTWIGKWTNGKQKLNVTLTNVDTASIKLPKPREYDFEEGFDKYYSFIRESKIKFHKDSVTKINQLTLQWYSEKGSGITLCRVIEGINDVVILNKVNKALREYQMDEVVAFYDCPNNDRRRGEYNFWIKAVYVTSNFLSINAASYYDCGGVHPNAGTNYLNFNLHTGNRIIKLTDVFNFYDSSLIASTSVEDTLLAANDSTDLQQDDTYEGNDTTTYFLRKLMLKLHKKEMEIDDSLQDYHCRFSDFDRWQFYLFVFRYDGVYINPSFPHVVQSCSYPEWSVIPYSVLKKYLKKESKFVL